MDTQQLILLMVGIIQLGFGFVINRIFSEFEKQRLSITTLFTNLAKTREMVLEHRIENLKDQLEQCRKGVIPHETV